MFRVLDTNHFTALVAGGALSLQINRRALETDADLFTSIVTAQEVVQGWLAALNRERAGTDQLAAYARFQRALKDLQNITILPFDADAARHFRALQDQRLRIGTMDLKIASICLAHDATLLTRNLVDFEKVPRLRAENWLD